VRVARASNLASAAWTPYVQPLHQWVHVAGTFDGDVARPVWYGPRGLVFGTATTPTAPGRGARRPDARECM
jgi:hypothetical protein